MAFAVEGTSGEALADGARLLVIDDPEVVVSAIESGGSGAPLIRLLNASAERRRLRVRWNGPGARILAAVDLAGSPEPAARLEPGEGASAWVELRPWQILSLLAR